MSEIPLPRTCKFKTPPMIGFDVEAHGLAMHTYLKDGQLLAYSKQPQLMRKTYGIGKRTLAKKCAHKAHLPEYGMVGPLLYEKMRNAGAYGPAADRLLLQSIRPVMPSLVYIHDRDFHSYCGYSLHETGGIKYNMAYDFLAGPGTPVLAPESGTVSRTAGHDPSTGLHGVNRDVFGWSVYLRCKTGFFFMTHFGRLTIAEGSKVKAGDIIGYVGDWPHDRGRSHTHAGFTSWTRLRSVSTRKIKAVAAAPRVQGHRR